MPVTITSIRCAGFIQQIADDFINEVKHGNDEEYNVATEDEAFLDILRKTICFA